MCMNMFMCMCMCMDMCPPHRPRVRPRHRASCCAARAAHTHAQVCAEELTPWRFFWDNWNTFDFGVVLVTVPPWFGDGKNAEFLPVLRMLRCFRILKLIRSLPQLQIIVSRRAPAQPRIHLRTTHPGDRHTIPQVWTDPVPSLHTRTHTPSPAPLHPLLLLLYSVSRRRASQHTPPPLHHTRSSYAPRALR